MKKIFLSLILLSFLCSCGEKTNSKYKIYSTKEKEAICISLDSDESKLEEYDKITTVLEEEANKGDTVASKELAEWEDIFDKYQK